MIPAVTITVLKVNYLFTLCLFKVGHPKSTLYCGEGGGASIFKVCPMSLQCVECAITEIYLLLVARNLLKYMRLFIYLVLRHMALLVASWRHRRLCRVKYMLAMYLKYQKAGFTILISLSLQPLFPLSKCR